MSSRWYRFIVAAYIGLLAILLGARVVKLDSHDPYRCTALASHGRWLDSTNSSEDFVVSKWQPPGCTIRHYKASDIQSCLANKSIVLIGDSVVRQIYWSLVKKLEPTHTEDKQHRHENLRFAAAGGVTIEFKWDPFLKSTNDSTFLDTFIDQSGPALKISSTRAAILVFGGGLWHSLHNGDALQTFKEDVQIPLTLATRNNADQKNLSRRFDEAMVAITPVHEPDYTKLDRFHSQSITPRKVKLMNSYLRSVGDDVNLLWSFNDMSEGHPEAYVEGGMHVVDGIADLKADILLNLKCNALMASKGRYPTIGSCCSNYYLPSRVESTTALLGIAFTYIFAASSAGIGLSWLPQRKTIRASLVIILAVSYCYIADRTRTFEKEHRLFRLNEFVAMTAICFVIGLISICSTSKAHPASQPLNPGHEVQFLPRNITDEWKGWMQAIILIYHYTGASQTLWIYQLIRLMVASYLFMTGYGHTLYFLKKGDYSLKRVANVLLRLNLLSCVLPYAMRTDYMFYYFAPLTSFWFLVVYLTMRFEHEYNGSVSVVLGKVAASLLLTLALIHTKGVMESIFSILSRVCNIHWDIHEWRFRIALDMFIVHIGMLVAVWQDHHRRQIQQSSLDTRKRLFTLASLLVLISYPVMLRKFPTKIVSNFFHPFLSPLPVLAYAHLRTSSSFLQRTHSKAAAWLGRCSLETFTLQFHIWLAADTKAILRTGLFGEHVLFERGFLWLRTGKVGRVEDLVVLTPIFLAVSWAVANATGDVTRWIVEGGESTTPEKMKLDVVFSEKGLPIEGEVWSLRRSLLAKANLVSKAGLPLKLALILGTMWVANWSTK